MLPIFNTNMNWQPFSSALRMLVSVVSPALVTVSLLSPPLLAQQNRDWKISLEFPPTEDIGAPPKIQGGKAGGSQCFQDRWLVTGRDGLTGLTPTNNVVTTVETHPTLFIYVPANTAENAEFYLEDEQGNLIYQIAFTAPRTPGVIQLRLPETISLEIGKNYSWYFALVCDSIDRSNDEVVDGWLQRIELSPDLKTKLAQEKDPLKQAKLYAEQRIWNETLLLIAQLRDSHPREWDELLKSVQLDAIAPQHFVNCCIVEQ